jgi:peptidoglycan/LPS O-acetylase OafA/YrhL
LTKRSVGGHLPSLDGLRAISIVLVLLGHLSGTRNFGSPPIKYWLGDVAHLGVVVFFVISGFLITSLLMKEQSRRGSVSLKLFYARRALRIFPASFALIGVVAALSAAGLITLHRYDIIHALTYTVNYSPERSWWLGHLWSLSIEEQFYMLWPFAFVALGARRAVWVAVVAIVLAPVARAASWYFFRGTVWLSAPIFPVVADCIAAGCLLALQRDWLEQQAWYRRMFQPQWSLLLLAIVFLVNRLMGYTAVGVAGSSVINIALAVLIHRSVYFPDDASGRMLNWKPLAFVGTLSYSLYLWQQLFLNRASTAWVHAFPQNLILAVLAALASYLLLEKPLMRYRERLRADKVERDVASFSVTSTKA